MDSFNREVLDAVLGARQLTLKNISGRMKRSERDLREELKTGPSQKTINELSAELAVPPFVFFMDHPPEVRPTIADFRSNKHAAEPKSRQTIGAIDMARRLQEAAEEVGHADELDFEKLTTEKLVSTAAQVREYLGIRDNDQLGAKDGSAFYALCRKAIEAKGAFVLHESFPSEDGSGFCLADSKARFIVINTRNQTPERRTFTLMHELGHALVRATGISDPFETSTQLERQCNRFAGRLLAPRGLVEGVIKRLVLGRQPSPGDIYRAARQLKISQQAVVVRLVELNLVEADTYPRWLEAVRASGNPDRIVKSGGGGGIPQERVKLAKYGFTFARIFGGALRQQALSPIEIYRMAGLKPKYQKPYFDFAAAAEPDDAEI
jgi:Zn-dependent peptidase ImmA (M78 family)